MEETSQKPFLLALLALMGAGFVFRIYGFVHPLPLWCDETFTGAIASQPKFSDVLRLAHFDAPNSVLFYLFMHIWQMFFGLSDAALRFPSLGFSIAAPIVICFSKIPNLSRTQRLAWAGLLSLWLPGIGFAQDARVYAPLVFFATLQTISFLRLLTSLNFFQSAKWSGLAALTMLLHYDAAFLAMSQGVILLVLRRKSILKLWPSIILFVPVVLDYAWQFPIMQKYAKVGVAWYQVLHTHDLIYAAAYPLSGLPASSILIWLLFFPLSLLLLATAGRTMIKTDQIKLDVAPFWCVFASLMGFVLLVSIGFIRPSFTWRYTASFEPGILLGFVLLIQKVTRNVQLSAFICVLLISLLADMTCYRFGSPFADSVPSNFEIDQASKSLMKVGVKTLVFTWDNPAAPVEQSELLDDVGGFFFKRAGLTVKVISIQTAYTTNPNQLLLRAAEPTGAAIIWLYDFGVTGTAARLEPPNIDRIDPSYSCRQFGFPNSGSIACYKSTPVP